MSIVWMLVYRQCIDSGALSMLFIVLMVSNGAPNPGLVGVYIVMYIVYRQGIYCTGQTRLCCLWCLWSPDSGPVVYMVYIVMYIVYRQGIDRSGLSMLFIVYMEARFNHDVFLPVYRLKYLPCLA